ncbi:Interleukin-7 Receptor Subunit Alpha, partial [Manis pentadactyla]
HLSIALNDTYLHPVVSCLSSLSLCLTSLRSYCMYTAPILPGARTLQMSVEGNLGLHTHFYLLLTL